MGKRDGSWLCRLEMPDGTVLEADTDDLTLDELAVAEQVSGIPWSVLNPLRSAKVAQALLALLLIRQNLATGMDRSTAESKGLEMARQVTAAQATEAFTFRPPTKPLPVSGESDPPPSAPTSVAG